jgi:HAD superfamily hydrolase (TIGR01662 family)
MDDLEAIHQKMLHEISASGGRIDRAYCCPNIPADKSNCRKPNTGMGLQALADFPEIVFEQSWMVGDSASDIEFGKRLGMKTALVEGKTEEKERLATLDVDWRGASLLEFTQFFV